jgi:hypothetical protein
MRPFAGLVERVGRLPKGTRDSVAKSTPRYSAQDSLTPENEKTARRRLSISAAPAQHGKGGFKVPSMTWCHHAGGT